MRYCKCGAELTTTSPRCRPCARAYQKAYYAKNKDKWKKYIADYNTKYPGRDAACSKRYRLENPDKIKQQAVNKVISGKNAANCAKRQAVKKQAYPLWDRELTDLVTTEAAALCKAREEQTGIKWHIDHVLPLRGKYVSGLHVWNNLAVIPAITNIRKGNRYGVL